MQIYRVTEALVPVRKEPSHRSEMVNELLYGEDIAVMDSLNGWLGITCRDYAYSGFIPDISGLEEVDANSPTEFRFLYDAAGQVKTKHEDKLNLVRGSRIYDEEVVAGCISPLKKINSPADVLGVAKKYLGAPYLWGGRSPFGIDCSGLVQMVFMLNGITLPRDAHQQAESGEMISFASEAQPGDLAFFENESGAIIHTGILLGNGEIIHASGRVRIDTMDHEGIYNQKLGRYTHKLKVIKRLVL